MPSPGPGGSQTPLGTMVAWITERFRQKAPSPKQGAPISSYADTNAPRGDIAQFQSTFQPGSLFSAGNPLVPTDRQAIRAWNYPTAYNLNYTPRSYEAIGFDQLRNLSYGHDITRLAIETRKDQIESLDWVIKPR